MTTQNVTDMMPGGRQTDGRSRSPVSCVSSKADNLLPRKGRRHHRPAWAPLQVQSSAACGELLSNVLGSPEVKAAISG